VCRLLVDTSTVPFYQLEVVSTQITLSWSFLQQEPLVAMMIPLTCNTDDNDCNMQHAHKLKSGCDSFKMMNYRYFNLHTLEYDVAKIKMKNIMSMSYSLSEHTSLVLQTLLKISGVIVCYQQEGIFYDQLLFNDD